MQAREVIMDNPVLLRLLYLLEESEPHASIGDDVIVSKTSPNTVKRARHAAVPVRGIVNAGNTCYFAALIQCIVLIPGLRANLNDSVGDSYITQVLTVYLDSQGEIPVPKTDMQNLGKSTHRFFRLKFGCQHDPEEALTRILSKHRSDFGQYLGNQMKIISSQTRTCDGCNKVSPSPREKYFFIKVDYPSGTGSPSSLIDMVTNYYAKEVGQEMRCDAEFCRSELMTSTRCIESSSQILVVQMVLGFGASLEPAKRTRINETMILGVNVVCREYRRSPVYRLYGIVVHINSAGTADTGHYIAYCRHGEDWYLFDDSEVTPLSLDNINSFFTLQNFRAKSQGKSLPSNGLPYLFFYSRDESVASRIR